MKRIIKISCILLFIVLAVLTFISRSVYNRNLPRVSVVGVSAGYVPILTETWGSLLFWGESVILVNGAWKIIEVLAEEGALVEEGDVLLLFDTTAFDLERRGIELEILRLEDAVQAGDPFAPEELAHARDRLAFVISQSPPTEIAATRAGVVYGLDTETVTIYPNINPALVFRLLPESLADRETFVIEARMQTSGGLVTVQATLSEDFTRHNGMVEYSARFFPFEGRAIPGQAVPLRVEKRGEVQSFVVPRDAVFDTGNNQYIVYVVESRPGLFGPEDYITAISVTILRDNGRVAAIRLLDEGIDPAELTLARDFSGWAASGDTVWVRER
jgi:multidrug efflux pump subunit AcrA (membrane-fusion protein)